MSQNGSNGHVKAVQPYYEASKAFDQRVTKCKGIVKDLQKDLLDLQDLLSLPSAIIPKQVEEKPKKPDSGAGSPLFSSPRNKRPPGASRLPSSEGEVGLETYEDVVENLSRVNQEIMTMVSRQQATVVIIWPARDEEAFQRGKKVLKTLDCDALSFSADDLVHLTLEIFLELGLPQRLQIPIEKMQRFILGVRDRMLDVPYHNWFHVFDVTQTVYSLGLTNEILGTLTDLECLALFVSALCHDLEHPGVNNVFLLETRSSLKELYGESSILERHHSYRAFELMLHSDIDLLSGVAPEEYHQFREMVMKVILATDMAKHKDYLNKIQALCLPPEERPPDCQADKLFYMDVLLKSADISNVLKPFPVARKWAIRITDEFFLQGDMEKATGMPVGPMNDRNKNSRVKMQFGFIDFLAWPYYEALAKLLPAMADAVKQIQVNRAEWAETTDEMLEREIAPRLLQEPSKMLSPDPLRVATWNIAAVNNNPFEYWVTHESNDYSFLMHHVQMYIDDPGDRDFEVQSVFTERMFQELKAELAAAGFEGLEAWEGKWNNEYKHRLAVNGFLKDRAIGAKRLISMPDRVTNTITSDGRSLMRPCVISMFERDMDSVDAWWKLWCDFMFRAEVTSLDRLNPGMLKRLTPVQRIMPISHSKYPAISVDEEAISISLQVLALVIFDAVLLNILNTVAAASWQPIKRSLCQAFNQNKGQAAIQILNRSYSDADVIFIQEAAASFVDNAKAAMGKEFFVLRPYILDDFRNQNSIILAKRSRFVEGSTVDVTEHIRKLAGGAWTATGDLCVMSVKGADGSRYLLASFHGDTNGLATVPVLEAVHKAVKEMFRDHLLIFGLDANTHPKHTHTTQGVQEFHDKFTSMGLSSCWGDCPTSETWTTRNARTYLQPQLQKAVGMADAARKGDVKLKDWILGYGSQLSVSEPLRDNTGHRRFDEEMVCPTLSFPSDHVIVSAVLSHVSPQPRAAPP